MIETGWNTRYNNCTSYLVGDIRSYKPVPLQTGRRERRSLTKIQGMAKVNYFKNSIINFGKDVLSLNCVVFTFQYIFLGSILLSRCIYQTFVDTVNTSTTVKA